MTLYADENGAVSGQLTVPEGVPVGTKLVQFIGDQGSYGETTYTARGVITEEERRRVTTITDITREETTVVLRRFDPLAQTFTLQQSRHIAGIDLWFVKRGTKKVVVQIRETTTGLPNQVIIAQGQIMPSNIKIDGSPTRIPFSPVWCEAEREYAIVVLTDDAEASVRVAELGKYDGNNGQWVTSQPYQVGVLLSSSNAVTWTPHQDKDLTFRLLAAKFTETTRIIDLGSFDTEKLSDVITLANIERPAANTDIFFTISDEDGESVSMVEEQPLELPSRIDGKVNAKAMLNGSSLHSPVLYPGVQAVLGDMVEEADYITRAIVAGTNAKVTITYEGFLPGQSDIKAFVQDSRGNWQPVELTDGKPVGDGWNERTHIIQNFTSPETRVKLVLSGTVQYRPKARSLRVMIT